MSKKRKWYSATEIGDFVYCQEQYRLKQLEQGGKIHVEDEENVFIDARLEDGRSYHKQYAQRFQPPQRTASTNGCAVGCAIVFILLAVSNSSRF
ncbi:hypothetical protein [Marinithermofilum abyssi]|uniref:hypothetical protein n=1 Tax=Marinithermofilum abyssi TaxID=1571185 RepID=UPI00166BF53D|nr:hypothetical protein [Marinithermofilum abyssi]